MSENKPLPLLVVKIGGKSSEDNAVTSALAGELKNLKEKGQRILLVHGGGITISEIQKKYGITPEFINGLRQTAPEEIPLVDMALAGAVNKRLVRILRTAGIDAWGISGADAGILLAESIGNTRKSGEKPLKENRTGRVTAVNTRPLEILWDEGFLPVFAPPATDKTGKGMNINADEAALALAAALKAEQLIFISDVPGVLDSGEVIRHLTPESAEEKISGGVISGGMIPKVRSAAGALKEGVGSVIIGDYTKPGDLDALLSGRKGTLIDTGGNK